MEETNVRQRKAGENKNDQNYGDSGMPSSAAGVPLVHNYGSAAEYAEAVRAWLWAYHSWQFSQCLMPFFVQQQQISLWSQQQQLGLQQQVQQQQGISPVGLSQQAAYSPAPQTTVIRPGGVQFTIPAFGRRVLAELIDCCLCFIFSLFVTYILVEIDIIDLDRYEKLFSYQADLKTFIDVTQDLFPLEIMKRFLTSVLEAGFLSRGFGRIPPGQTPGKFLMGLKVVSCQEITLVSSRDHRVVIHPSSTDVTYSNALTRSLIKNFALGFLFPICVVMFTFRYNRAVYDLAANTVVVEADR